jgi:site-specific recombinase XerD
VSETVIKALAEYYSRHDVTDWFFSGADPGKHLSICSAQHIFEHALKSAKIEKDATIHSLRHFFATRLLESGTDIRRKPTLKFTNTELYRNDPRQFDIIPQKRYSVVYCMNFEY